MHPRQQTALRSIQDELPIEWVPLLVRAKLALHIATCMAYLHDMGVVHFDIKLDNLLLDGQWPTPIVKIADFGVAMHDIEQCDPKDLTERWVCLCCTLSLFLG